ncbi:MAG: hypothetical protein IPL77_10750 [Flavobacteriales bacterium]|nr:hypothetical protein [Flavobacteriales bacterium]MBK9075435.1 hypothetical protein [Flavobacteriales bacterium]MBK9540122.1 hypothetical protein [Flavobacteriales bacterium]
MRLLPALFLLLLARTGSGQNLVVNGDFEQFNTCPNFWNQLHQATGWSSAGLSPDYFNSCDTTAFVGAPENVVGYQHAASGFGYAGGYTWCEFPPNRRELLRTELTTPLLPGVPVYLSMKVAAATDGFLENMHWTVAGVGMRFTMAPLWYDQMSPLPDQAVLSMPTAPTDTSIWYVVSGTYTPDSAYAHLAVGNFFSDSLVTPVVLNPAGTHPCAYVYIDDVCVSYDPDDCDMVSSLADLSSDSGAGLSIIPNPAWGSCSITWPSSLGYPAHLVIHDATGRCISVFEQLDRGEVLIDTDCFLPGPYHLLLETPAGHRSATVIVVSNP